MLAQDTAPPGSLPAARRAAKEAWTPAAGAEGQVGVPLAPPRERACVLGIPLDMVRLPDAVRQIDASARTRKPLFISTANLNFLALSHRSPQFRDSLWASDLCTADGIAIVLLCRLLGIAIPERVAGSDFVPALAQGTRSGHDRPLTLFFFGGTEEAGPGACKAVNAMNPAQIRCLGSLSPGFGTIEDMSGPDVIAGVNKHAPDFLIVSLGAEKGQAWIMRNRASLTAPVVSHLGAAINFLSGSVRRAPRSVQSLGLEWLWRIKEERHLASRYWKDGMFLAGVLLRRVLPLACWLRWNGWRWRKERLKVELAEPHDGHLAVTLSGAAARGDVEVLRQALAKALVLAPRVTVDLSGLKWADLFMMASLKDAQQSARAQGARIDFRNAASTLRRGLSLNGLDGLLGG